MQDISRVAQGFLVGIGLIETGTMGILQRETDSKLIITHHGKSSGRSEGKSSGRSGRSGRNGESTPAFLKAS